MKNIYKAIIGSAIVIAIVGGVYVNRPKIEVTASATANATSTVIVPTSTIQTVKTVTSTTKTADVASQAPQTVIIYQTYQTTTTGSMIDVVPEVKPTVEQPEITYVPTPVYTTVYTPAPVSQPVTQPVVEPTPIASAPVVPVAVEPKPVKPTFTEWPRAWVEPRVSGDWFFFEGKWDTGELGVVKCNGIFYDKAVKSGFASIIEAQFKDLPKDTSITCDFTVGNMGGTTLNYVTK